MQGGGGNVADMSGRREEREVGSGGHRQLPIIILHPRCSYTS